MTVMVHAEHHPPSSTALHCLPALYASGTTWHWHGIASRAVTPVLRRRPTLPHHSPFGVGINGSPSSVKPRHEDMFREVNEGQLLATCPTCLQFGEKRMWEKGVDWQVRVGHVYCDVFARRTDHLSPLDLMIYNRSFRKDLY